MRRVFLGLVLAALSATTPGCIFSGCDPVRQTRPAACEPPALGADVTAVEIGTTSDPFRPYADDEPGDSTRGGQGLVMYGFRIRLAGPGAPACATLDLTADHGPEGVIDLGGALGTTADGDGRVTTEVWQPNPAPGTPVILRAAAYGRSATARLCPTGCAAPSDGGPDAGG